MQDTKVLWRWASEACACKAKSKGFKVLSFSIGRMPKASSKQAPKKLKGSLEGAWRKLEACLKQLARNRNGNSRKLAGSLKEDWRKHKASLRQFCGKAQGNLKESQRKFKWSLKEAEGKLEGTSKQCLKEDCRKLRSRRQLEWSLKEDEACSESEEA